MNSLLFSTIAFACVFGGSLVGMLLTKLLPEHHLQAESKDSVKLAIAMIATLAALVLGLLIASAKGTFDMMTNQLKQTGAKIMVLDSVMAQYGPETNEARAVLRSSVAATLKRFWSETNTVVVRRVQQSGSNIEVLQDKLQELSPQNEDQRWLKSRALQLSADITEARALLVIQVGRSSLPMPFVVMLVFWLVIIFVSFGMFSNCNSTVIIAFFVCALSAAGALFLVLELDQPYNGIIKISSSPLRDALAHLGG
jgi:hypothetical protein